MIAGILLTQCLLFFVCEPEEVIVPKPYTIKLFVPDGNPENLLIINKMNWTGTGLKLSRNSWDSLKKRVEFDQAGVYLLIGNTENDEKPTVYIGQGDGIRGRIDSHYKTKDFWENVIVFVSSNNGLNRAHITWLEWALIRRASGVGRCLLDNSQIPQEPALTESEKADTQEFLNEMISIFPLVEINVFAAADIIKVENNPKSNAGGLDTIVVPAQEEGFKKVFLGENCWYAIRISAGKIDNIRYIAAYQTAPVSAITHYAEVESIEPYGNGSKYKINFKGKAKPFGPIHFGKAKPGSMQSSRYSNLDDLLKAKSINDLFGKTNI